jgi:bifunctional DNA-binding transcriptional regulator/antitoxin component of YhaV-PrlF toxin-antitoxin module
VVTGRHDPGGMVTLPASGYLTIPAALRLRCGLHPGDRVLLAGVPVDETLAAYSLAVVDRAIRARDLFPHAHGGRP